MCSACDFNLVSVTNNAHNAREKKSLSINTIYNKPDFIPKLVDKVWGAIIEYVSHLSFCKKRNVFGGDSKKKKKWSMFFCGVKERKEIYILQKNKIIIIIGI